MLRDVFLLFIYDVNRIFITESVNYLLFIFIKLL